LSTSAEPPGPPRAQSVVVTDDRLEIFLVGGESIAVPVTWYPRLTHGSAYELGNWRLTGDGEGIHWPDLDEDIRVDAVVAGQRSDESEESLKAWLRSRRRIR
jgi:hypothetical protein